MPRRKVDAAAVVFALLVVATVAAFAYAQRVKRDPLLLDRVGIGGEEIERLHAALRTDQAEIPDDDLERRDGRGDPAGR